MTRTKIGIIGAGNMGTAFAKRLAAAGHDVRITAKDPAHAEQAATTAGAKDAVRALIESAGLDAIDAGPLANARTLEPLGLLNIYLGYVGGRGTSIAPAFVAVA